MGYELFAFAIVVALMAIYVYNNERRMGEMIYKLDQTAQLQQVLHFVDTKFSEIEKKTRTKLEEAENRHKLTTDHLQKHIDDITKLTQLKQQQLDSLNEKVADNEKKNGMKLQVTENRNKLTISDLQKQIKDITEKRHKCDCSGTHKKNVAFHVNLGKDLKNLNPKAVVIFDIIILNIGEAYSPSNGLFTCPEDGVYSFTWTALTPPNTSFESDFVVNGKVVAGNRASAFNENEYQPATKTVVFELKKDDVANVEAHGIAAKHIFPYWSSYSGFRVF